MEEWLALLAEYKPIAERHGGRQRVLQALAGPEAHLMRTTWVAELDDWEAYGRFVGAGLEDPAFHEGAQKAFAADAPAILLPGITVVQDIDF